MHWQKNWPASRQENGFFEVWPVGRIFFIFTNGGCTCFYEEKTKIIARATLANHKTAASLKIYLLFAQKHGLHLTQLIALFTDNFTHLHYNTIQCGHEAISGYFVIFARNCLAFVFNFIVMQMWNIICEKGYLVTFFSEVWQKCTIFFL